MIFMVVMCLALFFITLVGSFLQTNIGFGFPVLAMIFLPSLFPFSTAVALCQIIAIVSTGYLTIYYFKHIAWKILLPLLLVSLGVTVLVTITSIAMSNKNLQIILGAALIVISMYTIRFSERTHIIPTVPTGMIMGMLAGIGNGLFGISGPPVALYLLGAKIDKESYLATIQCYFLISSICAILVRTSYGALTRSHIPFILIGWLGIALGTYIGLRVFSQLALSSLRKLVYTFVGISGAVIVVQQLLP